MPDTDYKIITSNPDTFKEYVRKVWQYKALIVAFAKKDLQVKFAQTWLRLGWSIVQPLTGTIVFTFFFSYILHWNAGGLPFPLYALSGLISWNFFSAIFIQGAVGIHEYSSLNRKIYYPKLIIPLSKMLVALIDLGISFVLLIPLLFWYHIIPSWKIIFLPIIIVINALAGLSISLFFSAFSYKYKDLLQVMPFITYFGIWITPVFFTFETLPESLRFIWFINPMAGIVDAWRSCLFSSWHFNLQYLPGLLSIIPLAAIGLWIYQKKETEFSDFI